MKHSIAAVAAALAAATIAGGAHAAACVGFTDVQTTDIFCSAVEWLKNRQITVGCTATQYCPSSTVTRAEMALFMKRLGDALDSQNVWTEQAFAAVDVDAANHLCQSAQVPVTGFPRKARVTGYVSARLSAGGEVSLIPEYSTDGGATWNALPGIINRAMLGASAAGVLYASPVLAPDYDLAVGSSYRFALRAARASGSGDFQSGNCNLKVEVMNRNGASSPFDATASAR